MQTSDFVARENGLHALFRPDSISADTRAVNRQLEATLASLKPSDDLATMRADYSNGLLGLPASKKSPRARVMSIPGPAGPIELRIFVPDHVEGIYLHVHGGGWMVGTNDTWDDQLELFGREAGVVAVSLNYRLAPEHVFPAAVEDCVAVAKWLIEHGESAFGTSSLSIGGESAGAHLAALTLTKLDAPTRAHFRAANLLFGCYDLSLTPSVRNTEAAPFVNRTVMEQFTSAFAGPVDVRDPAISPLYADLRKMPPAFFSVGSIDPLLDDSLFMYARWLAAGNQAELALYPGGTHGFNSFDGELARAANMNMARFLAKNR